MQVLDTLHSEEYGGQTLYSMSAMSACMHDLDYTAALATAALQQQDVRRLTLKHVRVITVAMGRRKKKVLNVMSVSAFLPLSSSMQNGSF